MTLWSVFSADVSQHCSQLFYWLKSRSCLTGHLSHWYTVPEAGSLLIFLFDRPPENQHSFLTLSYISLTFFNPDPLMMKSRYFEKRSCHKTASLLSSHQADNTFLPLALLAASTFLPFAVLILALKPWTFDLDLFFGWNVIFIKRHLPYHTPGLSVAVFLFILWYSLETVSQILVLKWGHRLDYT